MYTIAGFHLLRGGEGDKAIIAKGGIVAILYFCEFSAYIIWYSVCIKGTVITWLRCHDRKLDNAYIEVRCDVII